MKNCSRDSGDTRTRTREVQNLEAQVSNGNSWYLGDQFEQQGRAGTRVIIEHRWKLFGGILSHYLKDRASDTKDGRLRYLDAGCGDGINLQWAAGFFQSQAVDIKLTALDYNFIRVARVAEKKLAAQTCVGSLLRIPFSDSAFDIVICNHVLEHIELYHDALAEIFRILKPGGLLVLGVPNEGCFLARVRNRVIQRSILKRTDHVNFFMSETLTEALQSAGFNIVNVFREGFFLPHFWAHYALTCFAWGGKLLEMLGRAFPGQSSGLIVYAVKTSKR